MAGHSKFKNIMHRKGAQDKKRAKLFSKLGREITVATKLGAPDPDMNPRLRTAIAAARAENMPKDNIERAIKKGAGDDDGANYEEIRYEGYGPGGIAVVVETLTDNRNRTASEVRTIFSKNGGNLGETGSVSFQFDRIGEIMFEANDISADDMFETAVEAGADDVDSDEDFHRILCEVDQINDVRDALAEKFGEPKSIKLVWEPQNRTEVDQETGEKIIRLIDLLEDNDDVQSVFANLELPEDFAVSD